MPATTPLPEHATISPDVLHQTVHGQAVLLDLSAERYYSLDEVGTGIWTLLTKHDDVGTVLQRMLEIYQVDATTLRVDLAAFLATLANAGLVRLTPQPSAP